MSSETLLESYIRDVSTNSINITGNLYAENITQVVKVTNDNPEGALYHNYYTINDDGVIKKMGGLSFSENNGVTGLSINLYDPVSGESSSVLDVGAEGLTVAGGISVSGGSTVFETSSIAVSDFDITLGSGATLKSQLDGGGVIIGTPESGEIKLTYSFEKDFFNANTGLNVESGYAFTVNTDSVILNESGLTIDDIVLSQAGLQIGSVDPVSITSSGIEIGTEISLNTLNGLNIAGVVSLSSESLTIGVTDPVILNENGLTVGSSLSLSTTGGLLAGDVALDSTNGLVIGTELTLNSSGLFVGTGIELSSASGLLFTNSSFTDSALTFGSGSDNVIVDDDGIHIGSDVSITKSGGINLGSTASLSASSISFGESPDETKIDDMSVKLGEDILLNHDGLYLTNTGSAIYMGGTKWKISFENSTENLKFEYFDSVSSTYVTKMELKSSS